MSVGHACNDCGAALPADDVVARFVCPSCGHPHAVSPANYFEAFGVPERFAQDRAELESRFYRISRALHPDRFSASGDRKLMERSLERTAFLNQAYRALTDAEALRAYVLERAGIRGKLPPPAELAEAWFEIQDSEDPAALEAFAKGLSQREQEAQAALRALETRADAAWADGRPAPLAELHAKVHELQYLRSLARDVVRLRGLK